jgi:Zn-dependent protease with chaperone function
LIVSTAIVLAVIGLSTLYKISTLRSGGGAVARQLGATQIEERTQDFAHRRLRNVIEEVAIASGVPVPEIYVLQDESGINAFAAGYTPSDAAVTVTQGCLDKLTRDELQGVIAHEFSHVLNGDMRLNIRLMGVVFGILVIGIAGRKLMENTGRSRDSGGVVAFGIAILIIGYIGVFFGRLIKAGISRQREYLADASAVQFTRQTVGIAGALKKIGGLHAGSKLHDRGNAEEVSHMLFGDGIGFHGLFATHPPLLARIQALEPGFRDEQLARLEAQWIAAPPDGLEEDARLGLTGRGEGALPDAGTALPLTPPMVVAQVAQPRPDDYRRANAIGARLPDSLRTLAASRDAVVPLLCALLLDRDDGLAERQAFEVTARLGAAVSARARQLRDEIAGLHPMLRLPLAALAFPVLRLRPRPELDAFLDTVHAVVHADGRVSPFEYCLGRLLDVQVRESLDPARHASFGRRRLSEVRVEVATLLAVLAQAGHDAPAQARRAYLAGLQRVFPREHVDYAPPSQGVLALDGVLGVLDALDPLAKQAVVEGLVATVAFDGQVCVAEAELLRTLCATLHCPLPPMLDTVAG